MHLTYIVKLDVKARTMNPCTSFKLTADVSPENAANRTVCWSSSKPSVATVDSSGKVCALSVGTAVIYATANDGSGQQDCCTITVTENRLVSSLWVSPVSIQLDLGANRSAFAYATACPTDAANRGITWRSSNTAVATVNPRTGLINAQGKGTAIISATASDGSGMRDTCCVRVRDYDVTGLSTEGLLQNNQLLLLCNLIYLSGVWSGNNKQDNMKDTVDFFLNRGGLDAILREEGEYPAVMSRTEWEKVLRQIQTDSTLMNLKIEHPVENTETGLRVATFVDSENNAYVIFRGTSTLAYEWYDNGKGGHMSDTPCQLESLDYVNNTLGYYVNGMFVGYEHMPYRSLTVSGHSKGGNRAQYVAITSAVVNKCVSFDGQGFSMEFLDRHRDEVLKRSDIITSISSEFDYVNCLFYPLPIPVENRIYLTAKYLPITDFLKYHCPNTLLKDDGQFYGKSDESLITKLVNAISVYACSVLKGQEREDAMRNMMSVFDNSEFKEAGGPADAIFVLLKAMAPYLLLNGPATVINRLINQLLGQWEELYMTQLVTLADNMNKASFNQLKNYLVLFSSDSDAGLLLLTAVMNAMPDNITFGDQLEVVGYVVANIIIEPTKFLVKAGESLFKWVVSRVDAIVQLME